MVSCPDPTPEPGSVQYLEYELLRAKQAVTAAKDAEYLKGPRFIEDVNDLYSVCVPRGKAETLEDKIKAAAKGAKETHSKYIDALWADNNKGRC